MKAREQGLLVSSYTLAFLICVALGTQFKLPVLVSTVVKLQDEYLPSLLLSAAGVLYSIIEMGSIL